MSRREIDRLGVIKAVADWRLPQSEAAGQLGLCVRQVKRLLRRYRDQGPTGLISGHRGRRANNTLAAMLRREILDLVQTRYIDFGPTLAHEKLLEVHGYRLSVETLRQWMIADGLWQAKRRKSARIHPRRPRRSCLGELVQIDGSPHDWLEDRGPRCTLIVFIDDASSRLLALRFAPTETTQAYMETLRDYLAQHGRPVAFYSDKHSIFRINHPDHEGELTQFSRALRTLDIEPIHANTPQAKGRVERANQTLQDRLVKELRLRSINSIQAANAFLAEFITDYNQRFAVTPQSTMDAHRPVLHTAEALGQILCLHYTRKLSKNLALQFKNRHYQLQGQGHGYRLRGARVTLCEAFDGPITLLHQGHVLPYLILAEGLPPIALDDEKSLHQTLDLAQKKQASRPAWKPAPDHPWKRRTESSSSLLPLP